MRTRLGCGILLFLALLLPAQSAGRGGSNLDRLLPEIRRHTPGTLYDARGPFYGPDRQPRYLIKWMTLEGRILWFEVDARSGHILRMLPTFPGREERIRGAQGGWDDSPSDRWQDGDDDSDYYAPQYTAPRSGPPSRRDAAPPARSAPPAKRDGPPRRGSRRPGEEKDDPSRR